MRPIVIRYTAIVFLYGQCETYQTLLIETMQPKQIGEHVNRIPADKKFTTFNVKFNVKFAKNYIKVALFYEIDQNGFCGFILNCI